MQRPFQKERCGGMRRLLWFTLGFLLSCIVGVYLFSFEIPVWFAAIPGVLTIGSLFFSYASVRRVGIVLLGLTIGILYLWGYSTLHLQPVKSYDGKRLFLEMEASDYSHINDYGNFVDCNVTLGEDRYSIRACYYENKDIKPGDEISGVFELRLTTPDGREPSEYHQGKGIFLLASAEGAVSVTHRSQIPEKYFAAVLRNVIKDLIDNVFPEDTRGFTRALLLGDSSQLTYEEDTAFKVSGIRHIIAVSGLHISILFSLTYVLALRRRVSTALLGIPVLIIFAAVAGFTPSVNRACIMQVLMILALLFDKDYDTWTALAFSVLIMLVVNPMAITSISFQLSIGCTVGIFLFGNRTSNYILRKMGSPKGYTKVARLKRWFAYSVGTSFGAMIFTIPLTVWYFGTMSLISIITNMLTMWVVSTIFSGIIIACVLAAIWPPLGMIVAQVISWLMRYVILTAKLLSAIPLSAVYSCSVYIILWIALCYVLFAAFLLLKRKRPVAMVSCAAIGLVVSLIASYMVPMRSELRVTVFDVGEGQSILLQSGNVNYLVDCGGDSVNAVSDLVAQNLLSQGIFKLDAVILTGYSDANAGAVDKLLYRVGVDVLYLPDIPDDTGNKELLAEKFKEKINWVQQDMCLKENGTVLSLLTTSNVNENEKESGLCVLFQAANCDILITGDRGARGEQALLESYNLPELELLVAGANGAASATSFELLNKTMPDTVVVSSGTRFNHPEEDVLVRLNLFGCRVFCTNESGTVIFGR